MNDNMLQNRAGVNPGILPGTDLFTYLSKREAKGDAAPVPEEDLVPWFSG